MSHCPDNGHDHCPSSVGFKIHPDVVRCIPVCPAAALRRFAPGSGWVQTDAGWRCPAHVNVSVSAALGLDPEVS